MKWNEPVKLSKEASERIRIMLEGTPEERAALKKVQAEQSARWLHDVLSQRAYALWENAGRPEGRDVDFWLEAECQFNKECDEYEPMVCNGVAV